MLDGINNKTYEVLFDDINIYNYNKASLYQNDILNSWFVINNSVRVPFPTPLGPLNTKFILHPPIQLTYYFWRKKESKNL